MTLNLYSTYKAWKRENAVEHAAQAKPSPQAGTSPVYAALAAMGCGLGGLACADTLDSHPR